MTSSHDREPSRSDRTRRFPVRVAYVVLALGVVAAVLLLNLPKLPLVGRGPLYSADFAEVAGLRPGNPVLVAGVPKGRVETLELVRDHIRVKFRVDRGIRLGDQTRAQIAIATVLGNKSLSLEPRGSGRLRPGGVIPLSRTTSPYDVYAALSDLTLTGEAIDTEGLAASLQTLSNVLKDQPEAVRASVQGLSRLSAALASRDVALRELLIHAKNLTSVFGDRTDQLRSLLNDGSVLMQELYDRRAVLHELVVGARQLSVELSALLRDNLAELGPDLARLETVVNILVRQRANLDAALPRAAAALRLLNNLAGSGRWLDVWGGVLTYPPSGFSSLVTGEVGRPPLAPNAGLYGPSGPTAPLPGPASPFFTAPGQGPGPDQRLAPLLVPGGTAPVGGGPR